MNKDELIPNNKTCVESNHYYLEKFKQILSFLCSDQFSSTFIVIPISLYNNNHYPWFPINQRSHLRIHHLETLMRDSSSMGTIKHFYLLFARSLSHEITRNVIILFNDFKTLFDIISTFNNYPN